MTVAPFKYFFTLKCPSLSRYEIELDKAVSPVQHAPRTVSVALWQSLRKELDRLVGQGILAQVTEPTPWISSLVIVPKDNGTLRLCLDPKDLNTAIKRENYPLPTIEDVATRMDGARVFSILDVKQGFWHITLDPVSSLLTTFNTPFGRFRWCRMPFGIASAPEVFQRRMHQIIEGLNGVEVIADDFLVYGRGATHELATHDHDQNLEEFLKRCKQNNIVLNAEKMKLRLREVPFIGHVLTADGLQSSPERVRAVREMPVPEDKQAVRRFIGLVQYLAKFMPKLSEMTAPLRDLMKDENDFIWSADQHKAFTDIKMATTRLPVLKYYNLKEEVTIQCDASKNGLGAVLLQNGQPVAYVSRALTQTECRYAQIEKECLAIVYAAERFDHFIFGRDNVTVQSDHQPLETICKKPLGSAPSRLQRMLLRLQRYNITVVYKRGSEMVLADTLSRAYLTSESVGSRFINNLQIVESQSDVSTYTQDAIRQATKEDVVLQTVQLMIKNGWPTNKTLIPDQTRAYYNVRDELSESKGLIFKGHRIVIPSRLRKEMLVKSHGGHVGIEGCLRRLRESLFWPGMTAEARAYMEGCESCKSVQDAPSKEPMIPHEYIMRPWAKVSVDICEIRSRYLLIVVDYFSNFVEVSRLPSIQSISIIKALSEIFARWGVPDILVSDNGGQFDSNEFLQFSIEWQFQHITSSPVYPQSNGKIENTVRTIKRLFEKCAISGQSEFRALLDWRNTPSEGMGSSPAQRIMGRRCKTTLPCSEVLLQPKYDVDVDAKNLRLRKQKQVNYYNRNTKKTRVLTKGDDVRMRRPGSNLWTRATVIEKVGPRSFNVDVNGTIYRRNQRHLRWSVEQKLQNSHLLTNTEENASDPSGVLDIPVQETAVQEAFVQDATMQDPIIPRRSTRIKNVPERYGFEKKKDVTITDLQSVN